METFIHNKSIVMIRVFFIGLFSLLIINSKLNAQSADLVSGVYQLDAKNAKANIRGTTTDLKLFSFHSTTLAAGATNHPPRAVMDRDELIVIKEGIVTVLINDSLKTLGPGSIALIGAGDRQQFSNKGTAPVTYYVIGFQSVKPVNIDRGRVAGGASLHEWSLIPVKQTPKGQSRPVFDRPSAMFRQFEVHATTLHAGQESHPQHHHSNEEIILMMQGDITMHIGEKYLKAPVGSIAMLRSEVLHSLQNTGNNDCWYYAIKWVNE